MQVSVGLDLQVLFAKAFRRDHQHRASLTCYDTFWTCFDHALNQNLNSTEDTLLMKLLDKHAYSLMALN